MNYWRLAHFGGCDILLTMSTRFKYFPQDKIVRNWGLYICDVGWQQTSLEADYPMRHHPDGYYYTWEAGRRLSEYQLCLIFAGKGIVEFVPDKPIAISSGSILLLAPGEWHRCKPDPKTGWGTLWIGFNGKIAQSVVRSVFHTESSLTMPIDKAKEFKYAAMRLIAQVLKRGESKPFSAAGDLLSLLGHLAEGDFDDNMPELDSSGIRRAQSMIAQRYAETIDFKDLAQSLDMSYDAFRHNFVASTGLSPLQFQLAEKMRTAKNLIANTNLPISEIAQRTGFSSAAYFTRFFKSETKMSPIEYRKAQSTQ